MQSKPELDKARTAPTVKALSEVTPNTNQGSFMSNSKALTIGSTSVRQVGELYSLNDLHKAAGGEKRHQPADFLKIDQTKALVAEIGNSEESRSLITKEGRGGGTFGCKELVIAYAAWISAAFHLRVLRVFLAQMIPAIAERNPAIDYDRISPAQAQDLKEIVDAIVKAGVQGFGETWRRFQNKFKVNSYLQLPATRHLEAREYLIAKLPKGGAAEVVESSGEITVNELTAKMVTWVDSGAYPAHVFEPVYEAIQRKMGKRAAAFDDAGRLDAAFTLASQAAAQVQRAVFSGVMSGNADWKNSRYLVKLETEDREGDVIVNAKQIERNACVLPIDRFHDAIEDSVAVDAQTLAQLASICMARLGRMAQCSTKALAA